MTSQILTTIKRLKARERQLLRDFANKLGGATKGDNKNDSGKKKNMKNKRQTATNTRQVEEKEKHQDMTYFDAAYDKMQTELRTLNNKSEP